VQSSHETLGLDQDLYGIKGETFIAKTIQQPKLYVQLKAT